MVIFRSLLVCVIVGGVYFATLFSGDREISTIVPKAILPTQTSYSSPSNTSTISSEEEIPIDDLERIPGSVVRVSDGDTVVVRISGKEMPLRFIGIDAPETEGPYTHAECFGEEAKEALSRLFQSPDVFIVYDDTQDRYDAYDRLLAYVFLLDGTNVNEYLVAEGYAKEFTFIKPYYYQKVFKEAERNAQKKKKGLWGVCSRIKNT